MIDINKIQVAMSGIVGFKQPYNPEYAIVNAENQLSSSGYFVTDNPYAKIEYIKDNQDYLGIADDEFNSLLVDLKKSSVANVCNQVFNDYDFIDRTLLFKNASNKIEIETLPVGFVGYRIKVSKESDVAFKINRVLLDFDGTGDFTLLLFNTSSKTPIKSKVITITTDHQEVALDWAIDNSSGTYKGDYYIGYINNSLTVSPFERQWGSSNVMTQPINMDIYRIKVVAHTTATLFDLDNVDGMSEDNGLNLDITVYDDYTDFVLNNKMLFARAIQLDAIISCVQLYLSSLRSNANQSHSAMMYEKIMIELEGTSAEGVVRVKGLKNQLIGEITSIRSELQKLKKGFFKANQILVSTLM